MIELTDDITCSVYKGCVEFLKKSEWDQELSLLLDECSQHDSQTDCEKVFEKKPDDKVCPLARTSTPSEICLN